MLVDHFEEEAWLMYSQETKQMRGHYDATDPVDSKILRRLKVKQKGRKAEAQLEVK